jgi:hypothetical protein
MDYIVFIVEPNGNVKHMGRVDNVRDFYDAKRKVLSMPVFSNKNIYLVRADNFMKVNK